jgi:hypothetical protein
MPDKNMGKYVTSLGSSKQITFHQSLQKYIYASGYQMKTLKYTINVKSEVVRRVYYTVAG